MPSSFFSTLFSLASLFTISAAKINFVQTPGQIRRCNISEFKWAGSDFPWEFNARLRNETHKHDYEGMITWKNSSFTVYTDVPAGWYLSFWVRDWGNPRQTSDSIEYVVLDSSRCMSSTSITTSTGVTITGNTTSGTSTLLNTTATFTTGAFTTTTRGAPTSTYIDWMISSPAVMVVIPSGSVTVIPSPAGFESRGRGPVLAAIVISVLLVVTIPIVLLVFHLRRRRREGKDLPKSLQKMAEFSKIKSEKDASKSKENLVEEGLQLDEPQSLNSPIPLSVTTSRTFETPFSSQAGLVIPSSKELRMRAGGAYGSPAPNRDDSMSVSDISAGETFQTDTVSVWPTATNAPSETTTSRPRGDVQAQEGQEPTRTVPTTNPNSLFALIGRELEQILQERDTEATPPSTVIDTSSSSSASGSPFSDSNAVERPEVQVNISPPPPPSSEPTPEAVEAPLIPPPSSSDKQPLTLSIPSATSIAERLSASPRSGTSRTPISRRDMELLADLVAQRLSRDRRGDGVHSPTNEAPPSYS